MNRTIAILITLLILIGCAAPQEPTPSKPPWNPNKTFTESCSDTPGHAVLENTEASLVEIQLACIAKDHPDQGRTAMSYHPTLAEVARARAQDMSEHGFYGAPNPPHIDRYGFGPEWYLCDAGYEFAPGACDEATADPTMNRLEIIAALWDSEEHPADAMSAFMAWLDSEEHKKFLLAEQQNYTDFTNYGVGHAYSPVSPDHGNPTHYWVFISAPPPLSK